MSEQWTGNSIRPVPQRRISEKVNECMARKDYAGVERVLLYWLEEAKAGRDLRGQLMIRNEMVGHYRKTGEREKAHESAEDAIRLIREMDFQVDAVYINKIYPSEALAGYFSAFEDLQEENIRRACDYFDQQHIFRLWLQPEELRGPEALNMAAKQLYLDKDP